ncbi:InlB B-repeat-containing protein [Solibacillus sp. FSL H8-0538]|uniref:InlB B-repeat-containing protein n=1 Tax=Solibacillus sp. FSL H8-0538 TaxID=2921400 RepID=UPI0030FBA665
MVQKIMKLLLIFMIIVGYLPNGNLIENRVEAATTTTKFTGSLDGSKKFNRPIFYHETNGLGAPWDSISWVYDTKDSDPRDFYGTQNTKYNYYIQYFTPSITGTYSIEVTDAKLVVTTDGFINDTALFVYENSFNSTNPINNILKANDDTSETNYFSTIPSIDLTAGTNYIIVMTSYHAGDTGTADFAITGPGSVTNSDNPISSTTSPTVTTTTPATDVTATGATVGGDVTADGGATVTERGIVYGPTSNPEIGASGVTKVTANDAGTTGVFSVALSNLTADTTYHYRAYATNSKGIAYGADQTFATPAPINSYTVTFNSNEGSSVTSQTVNQGETVTAPTAPTKTGFTFEGWYSDADLNTAYVFSTPVTSHLSLYAKWTAVPTYTVKYNGNGSVIGTVPTDSGAYAKDASVTVAGNSGDLEKVGHAFTGWNTKADGTGTAYLPNATLTMGEENVTLYAQWAINKYDVTFETDGGSAINKMTVDYNKVITAPTAPTKTGFIFDGWYSDADLKTAYVFSTPVTSHLSLYAKWTAIPSAPTYTVKYNGNGSVIGTVPTDSGAYAKDASVTVAGNSGDLEKVGYTFTGWNTKADGTGTAYLPNTTLTMGEENIILYAQWAINKYDVTFETNGGSTVSTVTVDYNKVLTAPTAPTKTGFTFEGWYSDADLNTAYVFSTPVTSHLSLYAKWKTAEVAITVTIGNVVAGKGQTVEIPVSINDPSTGIGAYGIQIDFDPNVLEVEEIISTKPNDGDFSQNIVNEQGYLRVGWFDETGGDALLSSATQLFTIKLKVKSTSSLGNSALTIDKTDKLKLEFSDENVEAMTSDVVNGTITVVNSYSVDFDPNDGSAVASQTVLENGKVSIPVAPTKTGFTFEGWYSDADLNTAYVFSTPVTSHLSLYAKWTAIPSTPTYTVKYNGNGSVIGTVPTDSGAYAKDASVTVVGNSGNLEKVGHTFNGWNTQANGTGTAYLPNTTLKMGEENVILYAQWAINKYNVTFETNSGSAVPTVTVEHNTMLTLPAAPTKTGFTFEGWYKDTSLTTKFDPTTPITGNMTLYAKWTTLPGYSIKYNGNGSLSGTVPVDNAKYSKDATVTVAGNSGDLEKVGHTFTGWNTKADGTGTAYLAEATLKMGEENVILYAQWTINKYDVTFETNSGSAVPTVPVEHNKMLTLPAAPTKTGFTFEGWYKDTNLTTKFDLTTPITSNMTLYAKWTAVPSTPTYTVQYNGNGSVLGTVPVDNAKYAKDASVTVAGNSGDLEKVGHAFTGWNTKADGTGTAYLPNTTLTMGEENIILYAQWTINKYNVTFETNSGSAVPTVTVENNKLLTLPAAPTKAGYTFEGWYKDTNLTTKFDPTTPITGNMTLYAKWTTLAGYTVQYNGNGSVIGTVPVDNTKYAKDASVTVAGNSGDLAKTGYTFTGWNTKADGTGTAYLPNGTLKMGEENVTLYAQWTINKYNVTFETNSGSAVPTVIVEHNKMLTLPAAPTKTGFTFEGWYKDTNLTTKFDPTKPITGSRTLYAKWTQNFSGDSSTPNPAPPPTGPTTEEIVVDVVDDANPTELLVRTPITRTKENGLVKDIVTFTPEKASESVEKLAGKETKVSRIVIPDNKDEVSETTINVSKAAVSVLRKGETSLSIGTVNATIFIPNASFATFADDLYFRVVPVKKDEEQVAIETRAKQEEKVKEVVKANSAKIEILGRPMTIETNMQNRPVTLTLPLPANATAEQIKHLAIFIEHSNGTKEVVHGRLTQFNSTTKGVTFDVNHFSTFTVLYVEGAAEYFASIEKEPEETKGAHNSYIHGYNDGTFRPNASVTRQQMAALLARQLTNNTIPRATTSSYSDTKQAWAKDEIEYVRSIGIMTGTNDTFAPNASITRAQMAAIMMRWIDKQCVDNPEGARYCKPTADAKLFTDVSDKHWAADDIARISEIGLMEGTLDGTFRPKETLTRAQAVKVLNRLFERGPITETITNKFSDVTPLHWAYYEIQEAAVEHDYAIMDGKEHVQH